MVKYSSRHAVTSCFELDVKKIVDFAGSIMPPPVELIKRLAPVLI